ncbi:MAG: TPR repeat-containing protein [Chlorobi bacterium OLB5]|nr:MAG: TPR repeat-containing protein [Chlorobi bacterium OLB5]
MKPKKKIFKSNIKLLELIILLFICILTYYQTTNFSFTNWDDEIVLLNNPAVTSLSFGNILSIFQSFTNYHYQPLVNLTYAIEYYLKEFDPFIYHLDNLILFAITSVLVYLFLFKLTENKIVSLIAAALFATHPLHAESVSWVTERKDMLFGMFFILSAYLYILKKRNSAKDYDIFIYISFILACFSKATAVTLPIILLLIDYFIDNKISIKNFKDKLLLFATGIVFGLINIMAQYQTINRSVILELPNLSFLERVLVISHNYIFYIYKTVYPFNLNAFYQYPDFDGNNIPLIYYISPIFIIGIFTVVYYTKKYFGNKLIFGILFYSTTIIPVLQIVPVGRAITADRFAYIPILGILFIVSVLLYEFYTRYFKTILLKRLAAASLTAIIIITGILAKNESYKWENSSTLYSDMIKKDSSNFIGYNNRGTVYFNENKLSEAENDFINAIKYNPEYSQAYNNLGLLENRKKNYEKAIGYFEKAISMNNNFAEAYFNAGNSFFNMNNPDTAIVYYRKAIGIDPGFAAAYNNLGKTLAMKEMYIESINAFKQAIVNDDKYSSAYYNLGLTYLKTRQNEAGINNMITAARLGNSDAINFCNTNNITWQK